MDNAETVYALLSDELAIDQQSVTPELTYHSIPEWDSVAHMNVIARIEDSFSILFDDAEIADLTTVARIVAAVDRHAAARA